MLKWFIQLHYPEFHRKQIVRQSLGNQNNFNAHITSTGWIWQKKGNLFFIFIIYFFNFICTFFSWNIYVVEGLLFYYNMQRVSKYYAWKSNFETKIYLNILLPVLRAHGFHLAHCKLKFGSRMSDISNTLLTGSPLAETLSRHSVDVFQRNISKQNQPQEEGCFID